MINDCLYVAVSGVFAFNDFNLPLAIVCVVFNEFALGVEGSSNRLDEVCFMVFGFMLWV